jgi:hypothetical protein
MVRIGETLPEGIPEDVASHHQVQCPMPNGASLLSLLLRLECLDDGQYL